MVAGLSGYSHRARRPQDAFHEHRQHESDGRVVMETDSAADTRRVWRGTLQIRSDTVMPDDAVMAVVIDLEIDGIGPHDRSEFN